MGDFANKAIAYLETLTKEEFDALLKECIEACSAPLHGYSLVLPIRDDLDEDSELDESDSN
jgi:hypothetical protein